MESPLRRRKKFVYLRGKGEDNRTSSRKGKYASLGEKRSGVARKEGGTSTSLKEKKSENPAKRGAKLKTIRGGRKKGPASPSPERKGRKSPSARLGGKKEGDLPLVGGVGQLA